MKAVLIKITIRIWCAIKSEVWIC